MGTQKFNKIASPALKLDQAVKLLQEGDLFFSSGNGAVSLGIKAVTNSLVSHVGIVTFWNQRAIILESVSEFGVKATPLEHYLGNYHNTRQKYDGKIYIGRHRNFPKDTEAKRAFFDVAIDWLGVQYDYKEGLNALLNRIAKFIPRKENDIFVCSEYVDMCFKMINIRFQSNNKQGFVFPESIAADTNVDILFEILPNEIKRS